MCKQRVKVELTVLSSIRYSIEYAGLVFSIALYGC